MRRSLGSIPKRARDRLRAVTDPATLPFAQRRFERSYRAYWATGSVPRNAEKLLHQAVWASGGTQPLLLARKLGVQPSALDTTGCETRLLSELDCSRAAESLEEFGYFVMPTLLDDSVVQALRSHLDAGPCEPRGQSIEGIPAGPPMSMAPTWWMNQSDILRSSEAAELVCERGFLEMAKQYLRVAPLLMSVAMWKSYPGFATDALSAQMFHFDNDRAAFVKMFVYLTDVDDQSGPHVYIPGSHRQRPKALLHGRRITDAEASAFYPPDSWARIMGPAGTVFFADTAGIHKGTAPIARSRSIFQVNLASDCYGARYPDTQLPAPPPTCLGRMRTANPRFLTQYSI